METFRDRNSESAIKAFKALVERAAHPGKAGFVAESVGKYLRYKLVEEEGLWGERFAEYAPAVGTLAPNFSLKPLVQKQRNPEAEAPECKVPGDEISQITPSGFVSLASYHGKRPVVLIFGSYT